MATNRVIKTDGDLDITATDTSVSGTLTVSGQATISGLAYPTSDGSVDQVLVTNGNGTLSFADAASGGADIDTIANASDASSYSGTAKFINITSSVDVTFTNADIKNRIITCENAIDVTFEIDNFINNIVLMKSADLIIKSKGDGSDPGTTYNNTLIDSCDIKVDTVQLYAGAHDPAAEGEESLTLTVSKCSINSASVYYYYNSAGFGIHTLSRSNVTCGTFQNSVTTSAITCSQSIITCRWINGNHSLTNEAKVIAGAGSTSLVYLTGDDGNLINSIYPYEFEANAKGIKSNVIVNATHSTTQAVSSSADTKIEWDTEVIDNTSSFDSTTNYRFTAPVKGYYQISFNVYVYDVTSGNATMVVLYKNGADLGNEYHSVHAYGTNNTIVDTDIILLNAGDYIELYVDAGSDASYGIYGSRNRLNICKVN